MRYLLSTNHAVGGLVYGHSQGVRFQKVCAIASRKGERLNLVE